MFIKYTSEFTFSLSTPVLCTIWNLCWTYNIPSCDKKTTLQGKTILHNPRPTTHNNRWLSCKILTSFTTVRNSSHVLFRDVFLLKAKWLSSLGSKLQISFLYPVSPKTCSTPCMYYVLSSRIFQTNQMFRKLTRREWPAVFLCKLQLIGCFTAWCCWDLLQLDFYFYLFIYWKKTTLVLSFLKLILFNR